ncbi:MAG: flagellar hook-length control protein FliK [Lachnospiraceae bacterium]|nr:flagellar hook-length control protein FliK [Lachnospiraceae bacterium]MDD7628150.1 flagellar hook-length control protein FliK [Lachnospiraceae bacterium]MDY4118139.1 flagellar hook-length control protein FliK [Lachnospiraceae bacterium]
MRLSSLFVQGNQSYIDGNGREMDSASLEQNLKNGMEEIASKQPGQSVTGEVIEKNGSDILLAIGKNQMLRAKLDAGIPVEEGQMMTFSIKNASGAKVILSPLYANTGNDPNVSKALQMAGIPENALTGKMVQTMMQEGMSIDRDSLSRMLRVVSANPEANVETMVQLSRLEIPVTENTLFQMEAYKNLEHQITDGIFEIADALQNTAAVMINDGDAEGAVSLYREILSLLSEGESVQPQAEGEAQISVGLPLEETLPLKEAVRLLNEFLNGDALQPDKEIVEENALLRESGLQTEKGQEFLGQQKIESGLQTEGQQRAESSIQADGGTPLKTIGVLLERLEKALLSDEIAPYQRESISRLFSGKEFQQAIKNEMIKQWLLTPEDVGKEHKAEELYEKLNSQLSRFSQTLNQSVGADTSLAKAVSNLSGNIDFMNQMNQMFTYIQLPLKLQSQEANGELYVYTNKKNLAKKDGEVSALLHLDMEHLGSVDVYVSMKDTKVSTQFRLKDDSALDLIAGHIDLLNERLNKRGYTMNASFVKKGEEETGSVMEEILKQDKNISILSGYSFDARA